MTESINNFDIKEFSSYRSVPEQYSSDFIKNQKSVIILNSRNEIKIIRAESSLCDDAFFEKLHKNKTVTVVNVKDSEFSEFIGKYVEENKGSAVKEKKDEYSLEEISGDAPAVNIINAVCLEAIRKNCSDIHIKCSDSGINVRFRIDGVLQSVKTLSSSVMQPFVN